MTSTSTIVHLITGLGAHGAGGAEMMLYKLMAGMDRERFRSVVVSLVAPGPIGRKIEALGVPVHSLDMPRKRITFAGAGRLLGLLAHERPVLLQTWMYHADMLGLLIGRMAAVPKIFWNVRCSSMLGLSRMTKAVVQVCARLSHLPDVVVVNSHTGQADHAAIGYRPRRWEVIPNGFDLDRFAPDPAARAAVRAELGLRPDAPLIGLIGRYHPMKDHALFLRAAVALAEVRPEVHFVLAGTDVVPANAELCRAIDGHAARPRIHLLGERDDVPRLLAAIDIATSSSAYGEGFPNVVGEAMACGVPCVVTDTGDSAVVVGDTGLVVPPGDAGALAQAWACLLDREPQMRRSMGWAARKRIRDHYGIEGIVRRYEELYN